MRTLRFRAAAAAIGIALLAAGCDAVTMPDPEPEVAAAEKALAGCEDNPAPLDPTQPYQPDVEPEDLRVRVNHPLFPLPVGARWVYEADTPEGLERIVVRVLDGSKELWDTRARIVRDTVRLDDELLEDTFDWYAQDEEGNVWYLGERTTEYEDGEPANHDGSWKSGVRGALPGVVMLDDPEVGCRYRQEYFEGEAEDFARVVAHDQTVTVPAGTFTGCIKTRDRSVIDPTADEFKYYCPGVGTTLVENGDQREELVEYSGL